MYQQGDAFRGLTDPLHLHDLSVQTHQRTRRPAQIQRIVYVLSNSPTTQAPSPERGTGPLRSPDPRRHYSLVVHWRSFRPVSPGSTECHSTPKWIVSLFILAVGLCKAPTPRQPPLCTHSLPKAPQRSIRTDKQLSKQRVLVAQSSQGNHIINSYKVLYSVNSIS